MMPIWIVAFWFVSDELWFDRDGNRSQNVLATCNFDLKFMYVLARWKGSAHDSKLLNDALSNRNGLKVPQGKCYFF